MNKDEIKAFLEALGYGFEVSDYYNDMIISWLRHDGEWDDYGNENHSTVLEFGLQHYLKTELGKHWREMWSLYHDKHALGETEIFTKEEFRTIWQAIGYYDLVAQDSE